MLLRVKPVGERHRDRAGREEEELVEILQDGGV
jgi:hypothetical protein